ncbi:aldo/keto reductase [Gudongella sp. SC589]|jgi:predicted aldo/keto reductase-like oxidoreductase|uniref:aldo/keto reductase n=1 Tax=Gudongella sp. SC589 TaxID=3385990 RepID=UPI003904A551
MLTVKVGKTGIIANKNGFGALPIQRISGEDAKEILLHAYEGGINFFDTSRAYSDSEEKIGMTLSHVRDKMHIATKTKSKNADEFWIDLRESLKAMKTDYIDIYQFHNPSFCPKPKDGTGLYEAMLEAKKNGFIKHIGITNHRMKIALEVVESGLYETIQFPFSYLATEEELSLVRMCKEREVGFIAMKSLAGGLINNSRAAYAHQSLFDNVLPIWGVQKLEELDEFLGYTTNPPEMTVEMLELIEYDKKILSGDFCRGCGYCLPCPADIDITNAARMSLMIRRAPTKVFFSEDWQRKMKKIEECIECRHCSDNCPYGLDTPNLLKRNLKDYEESIQKV